MKKRCPRCRRMIGRDALSTSPVFAWHLDRAGRAECSGSQIEDFKSGDSCPARADEQEAEAVVREPKGTDRIAVRKRDSTP